MEKHRKLIQTTCILCSKEFGARPYDLKKGWANCCSKSCANSLREMGRDKAKENNPNWKGGVSILSKETSRLVHKALRKKLLSKLPCNICGEIKVEGHHPDYTKPLEVIWLCKKHHVEWHKNNSPIYYATATNY